MNNVNNIQHFDSFMKINTCEDITSAEFFSLIIHVPIKLTKIRICDLFVIFCFDKPEIRQAESEKWEDGIRREEEQGVPGESCLTCQEKGGIRCG